MPEHNIAPIYDAHSQILILGSFPSVSSREQAFFYAHPRNRFWPLIARVCGEAVPASVEQKCALLLSHRIALWDVIASCSITASSDTSITDVTPNDISLILRCADIRCIFCNGSKAYELYRRYIQPVTGRSAVLLPSTSPANAAASIDSLAEKWCVITQYLE